MSKNRKLRSARGGLATAKPYDRGAPGAWRQQPLPGGPSARTPPPAAAFPKTDTHGARVRGGARGLPRRVPRRPSLPARRSRQRAPPRRPPQGPPRSPAQRHTAQPEAPRGRGPRAPPPAPAPRGRLGKFPLGLSSSTGQSAPGNGVSRAPGRAGPPTRDRGVGTSRLQGAGRPARPSAGAQNTGAEGRPGIPQTEKPGTDSAQNKLPQAEGNPRVSTHRGGAGSAAGADPQPRTQATAAPRAGPANRRGP